MPLSRIDTRLAARFHQRHIDGLGRTEAIARFVGRRISKAAAEIKSILVSETNPAEAQRKIADKLRGIIPGAINDIADMMARLAKLTNKDATNVLIQTIPRRWWRKALPILPESVRPPLNPDDFFDPGYFQVNNELEPATRKLSDAKYAALLKQTVVKPLSRGRIDNIIRSPNPATGQSWDQRLRGLSGKIGDPNQLAGQLVTGINRGENVAGLRKRVDEIVGPLHGSSQRIARTEARRVAETANRESWAALGDMLAGAQIVAVMDERTRPEHAARNGTIYYVEGEPNIATMPNLPDEPNCRCFSVPVLKEPSEIESDPALVAFANDDGDSIVDPAAYDSWFAGATVAQRRAAVGVRRYEIVRQQNQPGIDPDWTDFIDEDGHLLPPVKLKKEPPAKRAERKAKVNARLRQREEAFRRVSASSFFSLATA